MYAVIQTGGKQYRVEEGTYLKIEKLELGTGDSIEFDKVLMIESKSMDASVFEVICVCDTIDSVLRV